MAPYDGYISLRDRTWQWSSAQKISDFLDSGISAAPDRSTFPIVHNGPVRQSGRGVQEGLQGFQGLGFLQKAGLSPV